MRIEPFFLYSMHSPQVSVRDLFATVQVHVGEGCEELEVRQASVRDLIAIGQVQVGEGCEGLEVRQASVRDLVAIV